MSRSLQRTRIGLEDAPRHQYIICSPETLPALLLQLAVSDATHRTSVVEGITEYEHRVDRSTVVVIGRNSMGQMSHVSGTYPPLCTTARHCILVNVRDRDVYAVHGGYAQVS